MSNYKDVAEALGGLARFGSFHNVWHYGLNATFSGVIPLETKEKIREAQRSQAFEDIRVLAEADWSLERYANPYYADPIVVGLVEGQMWVIDVFDPTPLEEYIAKEFTT
jgi:hypothetical protein